MKKDMYLVWFTNGDYTPQSVKVAAFNKKEAEILAKAERIKAGLDYTVHDIAILEN